MTDQDRPLFGGIDEVEASLDQTREGGDGDPNRADVGAAVPPASSIVGGSQLGGGGPAASAAGADALVSGTADPEPTGGVSRGPAVPPQDDFGSEPEDRELDRPAGLGEDSQATERDRDSTDPRGF